MAGLLYADEPDYSAIIFRKTYQDLNKDGALMDRARDWLGGSAAKWNDRDKRWTFPSGATLAFGYLDAPEDWRNYDSAEYQYIGFDEATQLRARDYNALIGRLRRKEGSTIPLRIRAASNPGGESHEFFGERFVAPTTPQPDRAFIPARLEDNPYLDRKEYEEALAALGELDETLYRQRRYGDWIRDSSEQAFKPEWWEGRNRYLPEEAYRLWNACIGRYAALDTANKAEEHNAYSALTVGDLQDDYSLPLRYVARKRLEFPDLVDWTIEELAQFNRDSKLRAVIIENAASGIQLIQTLRRSGPPWLRHLVVAVKPPRGGKPEAYKNAAVWAKRGMMPLPHPSSLNPWLHDFEKEIFAAPNSTYLDQADSMSMLLNYLEERHGVFSRRWRAMGAVASAATKNVA